MQQRRGRTPFRPGSYSPEMRRDVAGEYNPLYFQFDYVRIEPEEKRSTQLLVAGLVAAGRLSKTEARQALLDLGLV